MKYKKIILTDTYYNLMLILLNEDIDLEKIFFFFGENIKINKKLKSYTIKKNRIVNKFGFFILEILNILKLYFICKKYNLDKITVSGQDHIVGANFFKKRFKIFLYEDGIANYSEKILKNQSELKERLFKEKNILKKIICKSILISPSFGFDDNVLKVYLTGLDNIPSFIKDKVELINVQELWNKKTIEKQVEILNTFSFDSNIKERIKGKTTILFTQPLSEDNVISEIEKIEIYSKILKNYSKDEVVIKTHPRETTDYKKIFKDYLILDNPFPFEIMNLLGIKFKRAVTLFSTAALALGDEVEVDFYGTQVHENIFKVFGDCKNIMETNKFLKEFK